MKDLSLQRLKNSIRYRLDLYTLPLRRWMRDSWTLMEGREVDKLAVKIDRRIPALGASREKGRFLFHLAKEGPGEGRIVEIGSAYGRSTVFLAAGSKRAQREHIWAVDPHTGDIWYLQQHNVRQVNSYPEFLANIKAFGVDDWIHPVLATSEQAVKEWDGAPIRLLFIDGWHTYDAVKSDIEGWFPFLVSGGVIVVDDYLEQRYPGVRQAVDELMTPDRVRLPLQTVSTMAWTVRR